MPQLNRVRLDRLDEGPKCWSSKALQAFERPLELTDASFRAVVSGTDVPVLVDSHADWCGPCRMLKPTLDAFARTERGRVLVTQLDTDANPTATLFGIRGIPTLLVFREGREVARQSGLVDTPTQRALVYGNVPG